MKKIIFGFIVLAMVAGMTYADRTGPTNFSNLSDVDVAGVSNGQGVTYNSTTGNWEDTTLGSGDVTKVGTPVDGQVGVWTGDGTLEGDAALTFDTTSDSLTTTTFVGALTGQADTVTTITGLAPDTATTQAAQPNITSLGIIAALIATDATINESIGFDAINTVTYASGTTTADWGTGNVAKMTFGAGNITTFAFTDPTQVGQTVKLKLIQDGTGSRLVSAWDADIQWCDGGTAPTLSTAASSEDWVTCIFTNTGAGDRYDCCTSLDFQ